MKNDKVKLALLGCGGMAGAHLGGYEELVKAGKTIFDIVAVCDAVEERAAAFGKRVSDFSGKAPAVYVDIERMIAKSQPDAVDISLPHYLHHSAAIACLESGADVLVEKPLAVTIKAGKKMMEASERGGRILAVAEQVRRWPYSRVLHWVVNSGRIGAPRMFLATTASWPKGSSPGGSANQPFTWRNDKLLAGGGWIFDVGVHYMDLLIYIYGDVEKVYGKVGRLSSLKFPDGLGGTKEPSVEDTLLSTLSFRNGIVGSCNWTQAAPGKGISYNIYYGSEGSVYSEGFYPTSIRLEKWDGSVQNGEDLLNEFFEKVGRDAVYPEGITESIAIEEYDFLQAVLTRRRPEVDAWDGLKAQAVCEALFESAWSGEAVSVQDVIDGKIDGYQREINESLGER